MNCVCFIVLLVSIGAAVSAPARVFVEYLKIAREIFANFPIGPVHVGDFRSRELSKFVFQDQEYELSIDAVIRRFEPVRVTPGSYGYGHPLPTPGQHSMQVRLILQTSAMDSKLTYKKKGSNESPKELNLVSTTVPDQRFITGLNTFINFDVNKRKVLGSDKTLITVRAYDTTSNCKDEAPGFCQALHKYLDSRLNYGKIAEGLRMEVKKLLSGRQY